MSAAPAAHLIPTEVAAGFDLSALAPIFESLPGGVMIQDAHDRTLYVSPRAARLLDRPPELLLGQPFPTIGESPVTHVVRTGCPVLAAPVTIARPDGAAAHLLVDVSPIARTPAGAVAAVLILFAESAQPTIEADGEARFRSLVQNGGDIISVLALDGTVRYLSPSIERILGYRIAERIGADGFRLIHPDDRERFRGALTRISQIPNEIARVEMRVRHRDGSWRWLESTIANRLHDPTIGGLVVNTRDVTDRRRAEDALRVSEERLRLALEAAGIGAWDWQTETDTIVWTAGVARLVGLAPEPRTMLNADVIAHYVHPDDRERMQREISRHVGHDAYAPIEYRVIHPDGDLRWLVDIGRVIERDAAGTALRCAGVTIDITEAKRASESLFLRDRALAAASCGVLILAVTADGLVIADANPAFERLTGARQADLLDCHPHHLLQPEHDPRAGVVIAEGIAAGREFSITMRYARQDGTAFWNELAMAPVRDDTGRLTHYVAIFNDISGRKAIEHELEFRAFHDDLTRLPNRAAFQRALIRALETRLGNALAVLLVDLDRFKSVNDTFGHQVGDRALVTIAARLQECVTEREFLARFGGDEFVILVQGADADERATAIAGCVLHALARPLPVGDGDGVLLGSIGIAHARPGATPDDLLRDADIALYRAKAAGGNLACHFDETMAGVAAARWRLENDLRGAIDRGELHLVYQPLIDLASGEVIRAEALLRWQHPTLGPIAPADFIPLAEDSGLIVPIGAWVLATACAEAATWPGQVGVSVNLSARQFRDPDLLHLVAGVLTATRLAPNRLTIEITEGTAVDDLAGTALQRLKALGVRLALDDFGTGYSSLAQVQRLPINAIKIDRAFVSGHNAAGAGRAIVRAIAALGEAYALTVVAEGIETCEQRAAMLAAGCTIGQGYLFARPLPPCELVTFINARRRTN